jgi:hypothetical protein
MRLYRFSTDLVKTRHFGAGLASAAGAAGACLVAGAVAVRTDLAAIGPTGTFSDSSTCACACTEAVSGANDPAGGIAMCGCCGEAAHRREKQLMRLCRFSTVAPELGWSTWLPPPIASGSTVARTPAPLMIHNAAPGATGLDPVGWVPAGRAVYKAGAAGGPPRVAGLDPVGWVLAGGAGDPSDPGVRAVVRARRWGASAAKRQLDHPGTTHRRKQPM